ncbi:MAG TPA: hypothetical protein VJA21_08780 [Verrucomicrobiae bacterium]
MRALNQFLFASAIAVTLGFACLANAQYKPTSDDGITASPRVRQQLDERMATARQTAPATVVAATRRPSGLAGVAASPKVRQMLAEPRVFIHSTPPIEVLTAGYRATGSDGITAPPKLRQQIDERSASAPVSLSPALPHRFTKN